MLPEVIAGLYYDKKTFNELSVSVSLRILRLKLTLLGLLNEGRSMRTQILCLRISGWCHYLDGVFHCHLQDVAFKMAGDEGEVLDVIRAKVQLIMRASR